MAMAFLAPPDGVARAPTAHPIAMAIIMAAISPLLSLMSVAIIVEYTTGSMNAATL